MPAKRKPPGTRVDTRPQRRQELHLAPTKAWWEEFWKCNSAKGRSI